MAALRFPVVARKKVAEALLRVPILPVEELLPVVARRKVVALHFRAVALLRAAAQTKVEALRLGTFPVAVSRFLPDCPAEVSGGTLPPHLRALA